ncbi:Taste receptor type 2 member 40 [Galemys pyrenaicus]|uniref:Taste receptor type 2 member 40 n=1 Tax=Galemys pyrenaicus TaxID=202257 RepID=A0A8J6A5K4_GALPY|nr:Taste receptor type 2 member 40 [Galemys pyrenaicus]
MATMNTEATDEDTSTSESVLTLMVSGIQCITGILGNCFIVTLHGAQWVTYNQNTVYVLFKVVLMFLNFFNLWLAAWFNVFYCVRIAIFTHPWFTVMRRKIGVLMPWFLKLSLLISLGCSVTVSQDTFHVHINASTPIPACNDTEKTYFSETNMSHLSNTTVGSGNPSMEAHVGAIKATSSFLVLYIFNAVVLFLSMSNTFGANRPWSSLCKVIIAAYPAGHSVLPILSNPRLQRAWKQLQNQFHLQLKGQPL